MDTTTNNMTNSSSSMDNSTSSMANTSADPFQQTFVLYAADGTPISLGVQDLDKWYFDFVRLSTIFGAQLGATTLLMIVLLMLGRPKRLRSPVFLLNVISLLLNFFRCLLNILFYTGPFVEAFTFFTFYEYIPSSAYAASVAAEVFAMLLLLTVESSLVLQARVVCSTMRKEVQTRITVALGFIACLTVTLRLVLMAFKIQSILNSSATSANERLAQASYVMTAISIFIFSGVFTYKLGAAILSRRKLGLKQFGPMQIIFIMGAQTAVIPGIFFILEYTVKDSGLGSLTMTIVALSLPLSALWASTQTNRQTVSLIPRAEASPKGTQNSTMSSVTSPPYQTSFEKLAPVGGKTESTISSEPRVSDIRDWDLEHGIRVDRSFGVART